MPIRMEKFGEAGQPIQPDRVLPIGCTCRGRGTGNVIAECNRCLFSATILAAISTHLLRIAANAHLLPSSCRRKQEQWRRACQADRIEYRAADAAEVAAQAASGFCQRGR